MNRVPGLVRARSGFKTSDQVQGQGAGRSITRSPANGGMSNTFIGGLQRSHWSLLSSLNHLSIRCEIPLHLAGRWGFETTSKEF